MKHSRVRLRIGINSKVWNAGNDRSKNSACSQCEPAFGRESGRPQNVILSELERLRCSCSVLPVVISRGVAQPGRAPGSGPGGRRFKSSLPDQSFSRSFSCLGGYCRFSFFGTFGEYVPAELCGVSRRPIQVLDGPCWKGHERSLRQDQRGHCIP
jgi:hypothetical protein